MSKSADRARAEALRKIVDLYKRDGKPIELITDQERHAHKCCDAGPDYSYLNEPGARVGR